jgi:hypothetical protein
MAPFTGVARPDRREHRRLRDHLVWNEAVGASASQCDQVAQSLRFAAKSKDSAEVHNMVVADRLARQAARIRLLRIESPLGKRTFERAILDQ